MRVRILQKLPGTIGGLPAGENFEPGRDYDVEDGIAATFVREGWAVAAVAAAAPAPATDDHEEPVS